MSNVIKEVNTEASLNTIDHDDLVSKKEFINNKKKSMLNELNDNSPEEKKPKKKKNPKIATSNNNMIKNILGPTLYYALNKKKTKKKKLFKSTNSFFETKEERGKKIKMNDDISKKKEEFKNKKYEKTDSSSKLNNENIDNINNDDSDDNYLGEKIFINKDDLNSICFKCKEENNIVDSKYEKNKRLACIINNTPFICSNIFLKNEIDETSIELLLGKDKCRFFEKNKNIYKGRTANELFQKLNNDVFLEINSVLNDKLYNIDPTKTSIGQLYKSDENYNNDLLKNRYMRDITNLDGNAFIRAFIFNYLEQLIVKKDIKTLTEIMGKNIGILKAKKQTKEIISKLIAVFKIIIDYIETDNISNACKILIKSFSEDYDFEKNMINYIRESLSESIISHQGYFIMDYLKEIIQEKYIKTNETGILKFDYDLYIKDIINTKNELQYELLIFYFLPAMFDLDLIIYTNNNSKTNKIYFKHTNNEYDENDVLKIQLFIKFGRISIIYPDNYCKDNIDVLPLISQNQIPIDKIKIKQNKSEISCYMCHDIPDDFVLIDKNFLLICKKCATEIIQKIVDKRYLLYTDSDNAYFHEEFYCNRINYTINDNKANSYKLNISINDIKNILPNNSDISNIFYDKILKRYKCEKCKENFTETKYAFSMDKCGHLLCVDCLKNYIIKMTDSKVIMNYYEYQLKKINFFCPVCDKEIYISKNLINNIFDDDKYKNGAEERLIDTAKKACCFCHKNHRDKNYKLFVIVNEFVSSNSSIDNYLLIHSICNDCDENIQKNDLLNSMKKFFCDLCGEEHQYNKIKYDIQRKRKSCCIFM